MIDRRATPSGFNDRSSSYTLGFITKSRGAVYIYIDSKCSESKRAGIKIKFLNELNLLELNVYGPLNTKDV